MLVTYDNSFILYIICKHIVTVDAKYLEWLKLRFWYLLKYLKLHNYLKFTGYDFYLFSLFLIDQYFSLRCFSTDLYMKKLFRWKFITLFIKMVSVLQILCITSEAILIPLPTTTSCGFARRFMTWLERYKI